MNAISELTFLRRVYGFNGDLLVNENYVRCTWLCLPPLRGGGHVWSPARQLVSFDFTAVLSSLAGGRLTAGYD